MTRIDFYVLEPADPRAHDLFICRLTDKAWRQGHEVHIHCPDRTLAEGLDDLLWTFHDTSFVPHAQLDSRQDGAAPVSIGFGDEKPRGTDVLINLDPEVPGYFSQFDRVIETTGTDAATRQAARNRYRFYQQHGHPLTTHTINPRHG